MGENANSPPNELCEDAVLRERYNAGEAYILAPRRWLSTGYLQFR